MDLFPVEMELSTGRLIQFMRGCDSVTFRGLVEAEAITREMAIRIGRVERIVTVDRYRETGVRNLFVAIGTWTTGGR